MLLWSAVHTVNAIFTVTNSVLFPLHTLSLLLICLLCICKYVSIFHFNCNVFLICFPVEVEVFCGKPTTAFTLKLPHFLPAAALDSPPFYLTSIPPSIPPSLPTHTLSDVYSFLTSRHQPSLMRSEHNNKP